MSSAPICIVRHGETDWNKRGVLQGWLDVPINDLGRRQAHALAASLVDAGLSAVWCSPLVRARETADIVTKQLNLPPPFVHAGIKEKHFGAVQGIPKHELAEMNPVLLEQIIRRNPAAEFAGGETMNEFADRVLAAFDEIGQYSGINRVLVITHGWVMDVITRHIHGLARSSVLQMKRKNGECLWIAAGQPLPDQSLRGGATIGANHPP